MAEFDPKAFIVQENKEFDPKAFIENQPSTDVSATKEPSTIEYLSGLGLAALEGGGAGLIDNAADLVGIDGQAMRDKLQEFRSTNPNSAMAADIAASIISPINKVMLPFKIAKGLTKGSRALRAAGAGGAIGAIQTGGREEGTLEDRASAAGTGLLLGAGTGGLLQRGIDTNVMQKAIKKITNPRRPLLNKAEKLVIKDIEDIGDGDLAKGLALVDDNLRTGGKQTVMADAGVPLARRARAASDASPKAGAKTEEFVDARFAGRKQEFEDVPNIISSKKYYDNLDDLSADQSSIAGPLYRKAFEPISDDSGKVLAQWDDDLQSLFENKTIQEAIKKGVKDIEDEAFNKGVSPQLNELAITNIGKTGELTTEYIPNLRVMDAAKRGLDRIIYGDKNRNPLTGKLSDEIEGFGSTRNMEGLRKKLVNKLDEVTTNEDGVSIYKQARAAYAGPAKAKDAMLTGRRFLRGDEEQGKRIFDRLNESEQEAFLVGVRQEIKKMLTQDRVSALNKFADKKDDLWTRLENVLPPEKYNAFKKSMQNQITKAKTEKFLDPRAGAATAGKKEALKELGKDFTTLDNTETALRQGGVTGLFSLPVTALKNYLQKPNPKVAEELANILINVNPAQQRAFVKRVRDLSPNVGSKLSEILIRGSMPVIAD